MSLGREELLSRLKALPETRLTELIFVFKLDDTIATKAAPTERAIELIKAVESQGPDAYAKLVDRVLPEATRSGPALGDIPASAPKLAPSRLTRHAARNFFGRDQELELIDKAWEDPGAHVFSLVAWGGVGKTALVTRWVATRMIANAWRGVERYFDWSFYSQGTGESRQTSSDLFINDALTFFGDPDPVKGSPWERGE